MKVDGFFVKLHDPGSGRDVFVPVVLTGDSHNVPPRDGTLGEVHVLYGAQGGSDGAWFRHDRFYWHDDGGFLQCTIEDLSAALAMARQDPGGET